MFRKENLLEKDQVPEIYHRFDLEVGITTQVYVCILLFLSRAVNLCEQKNV